MSGYPGPYAIAVDRAPSILLYDGRKAAFRRAVAIFTYGLDDLVPIPLESEPARRLVETQFGYRPFVFALVDEESIHVGGTAVRRTLIARGVAPSVAGSLERLYAKHGDAFGRIVHGEAPADLHGTFELDPAARRHLEAIRERESGRRG